LYLRSTNEEKDPFRVQQQRPTLVASRVSTPASEENSTTVLPPPYGDIGVPSAVEVHQAVVALCPGTPSGL